MLHFLLHFIPVSWYGMFVHIIFAVGLVMYIIGQFSHKVQSFTTSGILLGLVDQVTPYVVMLRTIGVVMMLVGIYYEGSYNSEVYWQSKLQDLQNKVQIAEKRATDANANIQTRIIYRTKVIKTNTEKQKEVLKESAQKIDSECKVTPEAVDIINSAAKGDVK